MIGWFKKKAQEPEACKHYKSAGDKYPTNMRCVIRFNDHHKSIGIPYGIHECAECGKRAFSCVGYHMMGNDTSSKVDEFIAYKISLDDLTAYFDRKNYWHKLEKIK